MLTSQGSESIAVQAIKRGAQDYLVKDELEAETLSRTLRYAIERKQAELELRASESHARAIFEAAMDCIVAVNKHLRIVDFNMAAERTTGYRRTDVIGEDVGELLFPESLRPRVYKNLKQYLSTREQGSMLGRRLELPALCKDGSQFIAEMSVQPLPIRSDAVLAIFLQNITKRKQAEADLRKARDELEERVDERTAELRQANEKMHRHQQELAHVSRLHTMGEMASGLAHELNQPLTAIAGYVDTCLHLMEGDAWTQDRIVDQMEKTAAQTRRAGQIIQRLRKLVSKRATERSSFDMNEAVLDTVSLLSPDATALDVQINLQLSDDLPPVYADLIQIQQVIVNVARNALEADSSPILSSDEVDKFFNPFYTTKAEGLGMGLSISRSIIEAHGDNLTATANPDGGVTFRFALPPSDAQPTQERGSTLLRTKS
jgi:two-component system sensor kinase FixL